MQDERTDTPLTAERGAELKSALAAAYEEGCIATHKAIQNEPELALMPVESAEFGEAADDYATAAVDALTIAEAAAGGGGVDLDAYDAGLLSDYGGGNVDWWWDYIRAELNRAHEFYQSQAAAPPATIPTPAPAGEGGETWHAAFKACVLRRDYPAALAMLRAPAASPPVPAPAGGVGGGHEVTVDTWLARVQSAFVAGWEVSGRNYNGDNAEADDSLRAAAKDWARGLLYRHEREAFDRAGSLSAPLLSAPSPEPTADVGGELREKVAKSLAAMIVEYVEGGIASNQDWRTGLATIIEARMQRFAGKGGQ